MKTWILLLALSFAPLAYAGDASSTQAAAPIYEITATGDIEIGPDGRVHHYELDKGQTPVIEQALARNIEQWRFEPILVDGRPVIGATRMRISINAEPTATGDYQLRVNDVWFGEPSRSAHDLSPPRYPVEALRSNMGAKVVLVLKLDDQGKVIRVHPEQVSLDRGVRNERSAERWRDLFAEASVDVAKHWTFNINETVGGKPVGVSVRIPVTYSLNDGYGRFTVENTWRQYLPGPRHPAPWVTESAVAATDGMSLKDGQVQPINSRFQLATEVVGILL
ncbi:hypothetical protein [Lysobacter sp. F60174L2]|uniref:hypothetical protein n=1 Tax=Lysobacter sp. F60174L2 TaxID=3459295 RepID=UPI00403DDAB0